MKSQPHVRKKSHRLTLHGPVEGRGVRLIGQRHIAAQRQQELNHLRGAEFGCLVYTLW